MKVKKSFEINGLKQTQQELWYIKLLEQISVTEWNFPFFVDIFLHCFDLIFALFVDLYIINFVFTHLIFCYGT